MDLHEEIKAVLLQAQSEIQANMQAQNINASGRTSRGFRVDEYDEGIKLVLAHEEFTDIICEPRPPRGLSSVQVGVAPLRTIETGTQPLGDRIPKGFYYIIKQWTRDKGMQFARESERQTFAFLTARKIARKGTNRNATPQQVYSEPVKKASNDIRNIVTGILRAEIHKIVKTNF